MKAFFRHKSARDMSRENQWVLANLDYVLLEHMHDRWLRSLNSNQRDHIIDVRHEGGHLDQHSQDITEILKEL